MAAEPLFAEALRRFLELFDRARAAGLREPTAMTLATADAEGRPSARVVLLKGVDERGFVFYTNLESRKARHLAQRPAASLCFFWDPLMEQVLIEGTVERVSDAEADAYWATRERASQLGAWASKQSRTLNGPDVLAREIDAMERRFAGQTVPRPAHWSGYRLIPSRIEFWIARPHRLNERTLYHQQPFGWTRAQLYP